MRINLTGSILKNKASLTMIELLTVVVLIAVISVSGVFALNQLITKRAEKEMRIILTDLCWLRSRARATNTDQIFHVDIFQKIYYLYNQNIASANLLKQENFTYPWDFPSSDIVFLAGSGLPNNYYTITLNLSGKTKTILIDNTTGYIGE